MNCQQRGGSTPAQPRDSIGARGGGDLFPIPRMHEEPDNPNISRGCRQRQLRRLAHARRVNETIDSLNWMAGCTAHGASFPQFGHLHAEVHERVQGLISLRGSPAEALTPQEASRELLRGRVGYELDPANPNLAPYKEGSVSLPGDVKGAPMVRDLLPEEDQAMLDGFDQRMLREREEFEQLSAASTIKPYMDPALQRNKRRYKRFLQDLQGRGLLHFTRQPQEFVGVFFVKKKSGALRLIIDARPANRRFRDPPGVHLCTAEGLARIEVEMAEAGGDDLPADVQHDLEVWLGTADISDCFHRLRIDPVFASYFCLPPVTAREARLTELRGEELCPSAQVWPCLAALPMGFSWSLYFAQRAGEHQVSQVPRLRTSAWMRDRGPPAVLGGQATLHHYLYVDNLGILGLEKQEVSGALDAAREHLEGKGLLTHEASLSCDDVEVLGVTLDAGRRRTALTDKRYWRLEKGLEWLLQRRRTSGRVLEAFVGHMTFAGLVARGSLSCFHAIYRFIQKEYFSNVELWPSVRAELRAFKGLLPLLGSDWVMGWSETVTASDAGPTGWGVCVSRWAPKDVARHGRVSERARFRCRAALPAREAAARAAVATFGLDTAEAPFGEGDLTVDPSFPEIDSRLLHRSLWKVAKYGRWTFEEGILVREARALLFGLRRGARCRPVRDKRLLFLTDNMSVCLAFARSRARNFGLLVQIRKWHAYCFARNLKCTIRWIPSELNASDAPSRYFDQIESERCQSGDAVHAALKSIAGLPAPPGLELPQATSPSPWKERQEVEKARRRLEELIVASLRAAPRAEVQAHTEPNRPMRPRPSDAGEACEGAEEGEEAIAPPRTAADPSLDDIGSGGGDCAKRIGSSTAARAWGGGANDQATPPGGEQRAGNAREGHHGGDHATGGGGGQLGGKLGRGTAARRGPTSNREAATGGEVTQPPEELPGGVNGGKAERAQFAGGAGREEAGPPSVSALPRPLGALLRRQGDVDEDGRGGGQRSCGLLQPLLPDRPSGLRGREDHGGVDGQGSGVQQAWDEKGPARMEVPPGLEAPYARKDAQAPAPRRLGGNSHRAVPARPPPDGRLGAPRPISLLEALREHEAAPQGPGAASIGCDTQLGPSGGPGGGRRPDQSQHRGRQRPPRQPLAHVAHSGTEGTSRRRPKPAAMGLRVPVADKGAEGGVGVPGPSASGPLPAPSLRTELGQDPGGQDAGGVPEERPLAVARLPSQVREARTPGSGVERLRGAAAGALPHVRRTARGCRPRNAPRADARSGTRHSAKVYAGAEVKGRYLADLFSGVGGVAKATRAQGFAAKEWELLHGPDYDLTRPVVVDRILQDIKGKQILAVMLAPPCSSWSVARDRTAVIRTPQEPWGISGFVSSKDADKINIGNLTLRSALRVARMCLRHSVPFILENPATSKMFYTPELQRIQHHASVTTVVADFCQYGAKWRKATNFLTGFIDPCDLARISKRCCARGGLCSASGRKHLQLTGTAPGGRPWTAVAQPYPVKLNHALVHCLLSSERAKHAF